MTRENKSKFWNFVDNLEGDKVVWMIVLLLIMTSIVAIFSSTSLLAIENNTSRMSILGEQVLFSIVGLVVIIGLYNIRKIGIIRFFSQMGFFVTAGLLVILAGHMNLGIIQAKPVNDAWRVLKIFGFQFHVFEFTKVAMVMYLAWAIDALDRKESLTFAKLLSQLPRIGHWFKTDLGRKAVYIYAPIGIVVLLVATGSVSSALFIGLVMVVTIIIGGVSIRDILIPGIILVSLISGIVWFAYTSSDGKYFNRIATAISRMSSENYMDVLRDNSSDKSSLDFQRAADKLRQPVSAKIAIKEGGLLGKGPGNSTQRYVVSVMFGDYMFSFICEEYGLLGAIFIMALYLSLLTRGALIVKNCRTTFEKAAVAGLIVMITGQAFMHMAINVDIGLLTGQTLPIISHGTSSFLMFCVAFGIILSISRIAKKPIEKETRMILEEEGELAVRTYADVEDPNAPSDAIQQSLRDVENIEDQFNQEF